MQSPPLNKNVNKKQGFTLIELSIVLVVVSLLVGGTLVGMDLIKIAKSRQLMAEFQTIEAAYRTFQLKYNCIAGDCRNATSFGFSANGNGNKTIDLAPHSNPPENNCITGPVNMGYWQELINFWGHLSKAGLIDGEYQEITNWTGAPTADTAESTARYIYRSKAFPETFIQPYSRCGKTYIRTGLAKISQFRGMVWRDAYLSTDTVNYITTKVANGAVADESCGTNHCFEPNGKAIPIAGIHSWIHGSQFYANPTLVYNAAGVTGNVACVEQVGGIYRYKTDGKCAVGWRLN